METDASSRNVDDSSSWQRSGQPHRKRQRGEAGSSKFAGAVAAASAAAAVVVVANQDELEVVKVDKTRRGKFKFDDVATADVLLNFTRSPNPTEGPLLESQVVEDTERKLHLHSGVLVQSRYFKALLSERWRESKQPMAKEETRGKSQENNHKNRNKSNNKDQQQEQEQLVQIHMSIPENREVSSYLTTLCLLYSGDFSGVIVDVQSALAILQIATELLFDECIAACIAFLEAVPWTRDEEKLILQVVSDLQLEEASTLLARLSPVEENAVEDMLNGLVHAAMHSPRNISVPVKTFVARMLGDHGSRDTVRVVLEKAFASTLKTVKDSVEEYSNPNVRGRYDEIEALQRQNLHTAVVNGRSLLWLVERMIELRVAKTAVMEWSEQGSFTANLKRAFSDDTWRNIAPGLPALVLRCTCRLASAVAAGTIVASSQVRLKLVNDWLPVLIVSRENAISATQNKPVHQELEDVFLRIILTLPMADAQKLLQQCLSFATRTVEDCPHLVSAFNTWFRRASQKSLLLPPEDDESDEVS
ncbi:unnamed protein product [Calypogeia fissa]